MSLIRALAFRNFWGAQLHKLMSVLIYNNIAIVDTQLIHLPYAVMKNTLNT